MADIVADQDALALKAEVSKAMCKVSMADLREWKKANLPENQVVKRTNTLKK